jgi:hypothetical protein
MQLDLHNLPTDTALLHRLLCDIAATIDLSRQAIPAGIERKTNRRRTFLLI